MPRTERLLLWWPRATKVPCPACGAPIDKVVRRSRFGRLITGIVMGPLAVDDVAKELKCTACRHSW